MASFTWEFVWISRRWPQAYDVSVHLLLWACTTDLVLQLQAHPVLASGLLIHNHALTFSSTYVYSFYVSYFVYHKSPTCVSLPFGRQFICNFVGKFARELKQNDVACITQLYNPIRELFLFRLCCDSDSIFWDCLACIANGFSLCKQNKIKTTQFHLVLSPAGTHVQPTAPRRRTQWMLILLKWVPILFSVFNDRDSHHNVVVFIADWLVSSVGRHQPAVWVVAGSNPSWTIEHSGALNNWGSRCCLWRGISYLPTVPI